MTINLVKSSVSNLHSTAQIQHIDAFRNSNTVTAYVDYSTMPR
ncbi:hypothetical protein XF_0467 [Xylella fastidiosa 9a5c]|uniref:Uncharacterized protein n=1 Tax=Xylella fastidiosa (strain 9a5c) TaxID=160492 RepID=Q9PG35_XYLFA|nr:hypothetical protein XF_0467 [Xylella fastidiosa 9a5c]